MDLKLKKLHKVVSLLKKELPPAYKVSVNFVRGKLKIDGVDCHAVSWFELKEKKFYIKVHYGNCIHCMMDSVIHEWAHILDWSHLHDMSEEPEYHSATFGVWYAKVYRTVAQEK